EGAGFWLSTGPVSHNGQPNCQGVPAEVVASQNVPVMYVEVDQDQMRVYFDGPGSRFIGMARTSM
ncbi:MAG: hypothetical protein AAFQ43_13965, partial [Bacteroidota bacterium]